jgi:hypothetical protein
MKKLLDTLLTDWADLLFPSEEPEKTTKAEKVSALVLTLLFIFVYFTFR